MPRLFSNDILLFSKVYVNERSEVSSLQIRNSFSIFHFVKHILN